MLKEKKKYASLQVESSEQDVRILLKMYEGELDENKSPVDSECVKEQQIEIPTSILPTVIDVLQNIVDKYIEENKKGAK